MTVHFLVIFLFCALAWLAAPKVFQLAVGFWVGAAAGGFLWAITGTLWITTHTSWTAIAISFVGFMLTGIISGCMIAAKV